MVKRLLSWFNAKCYQSDFAHLSSTHFVYFSDWDLLPFKKLLELKPVVLVGSTWNHVYNVFVVLLMDSVFSSILQFCQHVRVLYSMLVLSIDIFSLCHCRPAFHFDIFRWWGFYQVGCVICPWFQLVGPWVTWPSFWTRWPNPMEAFSALMVLCAGNSPVIGEIPSQRASNADWDVFFFLCGSA